jgi:pyridinium-3,5-biscarboxylic acid mononucleotide sulfurtransferase
MNPPVNTPDAAALVRIADPAERPLAALDWRERLERLRATIAAYGRVVVAYSGGVDSSLVLRVAHEQLGDRALGVIGRSDSYAARELALATAQAASFGARVEVVTTGELSDPAFAANDTDRCYHCKSELYRQLRLVAAREGAVTVLDGTIHEDLSDFRPGRRAADERDVASPLAELGFTKDDVRAAAGALGLASQAKPASPCLASRIPYGTPVTADALGMIERAEEGLRALGFTELRLRHHGDVARIELPMRDFARAIEPGLRESVVGVVLAAGYRFASLDLEGLRSGSLNRGIDVTRGEQRPRQAK